METADFSYMLPAELIAQEPVMERQMSRLLVLGRETGAVSHSHFNELGSYLKEGDCLVLNDTRVLPARLLGEKVLSGGRMEFLLLEDKGGDVWEILVKPGKRARPGERFVFGGGILEAEIIEVAEGGNRLAEFHYDADAGSFYNVIDRIGLMPLPPYIKKKLADAERYQTVYSRYAGSAAAPTAGLHFTKKLLNELESSGINVAYLTLHVGLGTFRPVKTREVEKHRMHSEHYIINAGACATIEKARTQGGRIIAVGTTSCRVLETVAEVHGKLVPGEGRTDIFIYPGYKFKVVDAMITNFHLPESTLLMLVCAFAGKDRMLGAYTEAIKERYRFYSFGDAMLII